METITKLMSLLAILHLILVHNQIVALDDFTLGNGIINDDLIKGKQLVDLICGRTPTKDLCVKVLTSDPKSEHGDLKDLAMISLRVASANASGILNDVKTMIDDADLDPGIQQGLADCKETLLDAEGQLEDTIAALLADEKQDAQLWLQAALAAIDTCDASIPGNDDILSRKSVGFRNLCNIAVVINKAMVLTPQI